jgi:DNA-binding response OmpR family regulator/DNA-binding CsgD family transcriptional regulator
MIQKSDQYDILIVDDTQDSLKLLSRILDERGYQVRAVTNGRQALKSVEVSLPDLILMDVKIPEMDGYEVCRRVKAKEHSRNVPVIFISADAETAEKVHGFEVGAVDFIIKPYEEQEVLARVQTHLRIRELTESLEEKVRQRTEKMEAANRALKALLDQREIEKESIEQTIVADLKRYVFPYLEEIDQLNIDDVKPYVNIIRANIKQLISPDSKRLSALYHNFTPSEIKVVDLIRQGKSSKSIAAQLKTSHRTVEKHRNNIRKKLGILNKKVNLNTYLLSIQLTFNTLFEEKRSN